MWNPVLSFEAITLPDVYAGAAIYYNRRKALWCWKRNASMSTYASQWVMAASFPICPLVGGSATTYYGNYNGYPAYYQNASYVWSGGVYWYKSAIIGSALREYVYADYPSTYYGDSWYLISSLFGSAWTPRGVGKGGSTLAAAWPTFVGWVWESGSGTAPYGSYAPVGGASGRKYFGALVLTDSLGNTYTEASSSDILTINEQTSIPKSTLTSDGVDDRGGISYSSDAGGVWIIGTYSTTAGAGYWIGPAALPLYPSASSVTFTRVWNEEDGVEDPTPGDITVSFSKWSALTTPLTRPALSLAAGASL